LDSARSVETVVACGAGTGVGRFRTNMIATMDASSVAILMMRSSLVFIS
jgi:hypothetical protein